MERWVERSPVQAAVDSCCSIVRKDTRLGFVRRWESWGSNRWLSSLTLTEHGLWPTTPSLMKTREAGSDGHSRQLPQRDSEPCFINSGDCEIASGGMLIDESFFACGRQWDAFAAVDGFRSQVPRSYTRGPAAADLAGTLQASRDHGDSHQRSRSLRS